MRRGSLSALTITQRVGDGQNKVKEGEEKGGRKNQGAGMGEKSRGSPSALTTLSA